MIEHVTVDLRHNARCRNDPEPDNWFASTTENAAAHAAKAVCVRCPVRRECGNEAADRGERAGIVAGFHTADSDEWRRLHVWLGRPVPDIPDSGGRYAVECRQCGASFETRDKTRHTRCPRCEQGLVDGTPARNRLHELRKLGLTTRMISEASDVPISTLNAIWRRDWLMKETADRILSVEVTSAVKVA